MLIGNAGILGPLSPLGHVEPKAWDDVMAVNVTANWRLIRAMDPLLRRVRRRPRGVHELGRRLHGDGAYWGPYAVSKAALEMLARTYAAETASSPVRVNLFYPGPIRTRMRAQAMPGEDPMTLDTPEQVADELVTLCLPSFRETGKAYSYRVKKLLAFREPA